jgi:hypothetical protein
VHAEDSPTTIAFGEVAPGGAVIVTDESGRKIRTAIVAAQDGYPYSVFYADLGNGQHWMKTVTYIAADGRQHVLQMATPAPTDSPSVTK